jgi:hypothetical protein
MRSGVEADLLRHYERVSKFRGTGISEVRDQKCMACQVMLRPQTYNEVRSGTQTIVCDSCQRILYFNAADELAAQAPGAARPKRHHPKIDAPQAWYYRADFATTPAKSYLCLANFQGQASRRVYDDSHRTPLRRHPHPRRQLPPGLPRGHHRRHPPERQLERRRSRQLRPRNSPWRPSTYY